jgi:hypothetical protein
VTGGDAPAATVQRNATAAIVNVARIILWLFISLGHCRVESKRGTIYRVKYWEIIADNVKGDSESGGGHSTL